MKAEMYSNMMKDTASEIIERNFASRIANRDSGLFSDYAQAGDHSIDAFGWVDLCAHPSVDVDAIEAFTSRAGELGIKHAFLIGQGGSIQASSAIASMLRATGMSKIEFHEMDSNVPRDINSIVAEMNLSESMFIVSSKSGRSVDTISVFKYFWEFALGELGEENAHLHFVAITDANTPLESTATALGIQVFRSLDDVGGRFSALSVTGLLPYALLGVDVRHLLNVAKDCEATCGADCEDNPAIELAARLFCMARSGKDILRLVCDEPCHGFGLWAEQLVSESLGKHGKGILVSLERDYYSLGTPNGGSHAITVSMTDMDAVAKIDSSIPHIELRICSVEEMARQFIVWEYAVAMVAAMMRINPFDQPNVESAKKAARAIMADPAKLNASGTLSVSDALACEEGTCGVEALSTLFSSIGNGEYCSINAFLPKLDEKISDILDETRRGIVDAIGCPVCVEMGPKYLHSVGQFQKGGPNNGAIIVVSAKYDGDIQIPGEALSFAQLTGAQASGDFDALNQAGRKAVHITLPTCGSESVEELKDMVFKALAR